jgi:hypothetical protein
VKLDAFRVGCIAVTVALVLLLRARSGEHIAHFEPANFFAEPAKRAEAGRG